MAMDYGRPGEDYGDLAIQAVRSTRDQLKAIYSIGDAAAFRMVGVTPMIGVNDDKGVFGPGDARDLVAFANANHLGFVSYWEANRDKNACTGALFQCTNVPQPPVEFGKIFAGFTGGRPALLPSPEKARLRAPTRRRAVSVVRRSPRRPGRASRRPGSTGSCPVAAPTRCAGRRAAPPGRSPRSS